MRCLVSWKKQFLLNHSPSQSEYEYETREAVCGAIHILGQTDRLKL